MTLTTFRMWIKIWHCYINALKMLLVSNHFLKKSRSLVGWLAFPETETRLFSCFLRGRDLLTASQVCLWSVLYFAQSHWQHQNMFSMINLMSHQEKMIVITCSFVTTRNNCVQPKVQLVWSYVSEAPGRQRRQSRSLCRGKARCTFGIVQLGSVGLRLPRQRRQCVRHRASCVLFHGHHLVLEEQQRRMRSTWEPPAGRDATDRHRG